MPKSPAGPEKVGSDFNLVIFLVPGVAMLVLALLFAAGFGDALTATFAPN